jgi:hypothetical protein
VACPQGFVPLRGVAKGCGAFRVISYRQPPRRSVKSKLAVVHDTLSCGLAQTYVFGVGHCVDVSVVEVVGRKLVSKAGVGKFEQNPARCLSLRRLCSSHVTWSVATAVVTVNLRSTLITIISN